MAKKIVIENQRGVPPEFNLWTMEAVEEMLELFPEFKDKFAVEARGNYRPQGSEIDRDAFENIPDDEKDLYVRLPSGKYLVPYASTDWYIERAKQLSGNNGFDSEKLVKLRADANDGENPLSITLTVDAFAPACTGYGVQNLGLGISVKDFDESRKDLFKNIVKHELGHVFRATYNGRDHIVEQNGQHCTNAGCLMDAAPININHPFDKPFCDECMEAMRENLQQLLENENSLNIGNNSAEESNHIDSAWKKPLRAFYTRAAADKGLYYTENIAAKNFQAQLKAGDGSVTNIEASAINNLSLSSVDKNGNSRVPNQEHFDDLVKFARKNNMSAIRLADIKTPEFRARMVLACLNANPPMKIVNMPELNEGFFRGVTADTRQKIEALSQAQNQSQNNNPSSNTSAGSKPYVISRNKTIVRLEQKEKLGRLAPREEKMLNYARQQKKSEEEYEAAVQRTGNDIDPRTAEHCARTGLPAQNYYYSSKSRKNAAAWKLHLDVMPNRSDPTTKAVSEMLEKLDVEHKIYHGGENGKGMTIYVGGYDDAKRLSREINLRFGKDIAEPPVYTDQAGSETMFNRVVSGRFYLQGLFEVQYPHGTAAGICPASYGSLSDAKNESFIFALAMKENILPAGTPADQCFGLSGRLDFEKKYVFDGLEAYCAHKLYARHAGSYYNGKNPDLYEQKIFEGIIPEAGSAERAKWDAIADRFERHISQEYPRGITAMQQLSAGYTPIDFSKLPPVAARQNNNGNSRP